MKQKFFSVVEAVAFHAKKTPEKVAILEGQRECSYKELWEKIGDFAVFLTKNGVKKEDYVVLRASNTIGYLTRLLAIHLIGAVAVPLEKNVPKERIREIVDEVEPAMLISDIVPDGISCPAVMEKEEVPSSEYKEEYFPKGNQMADILFTTGTTGKSKGVMLTHRSIVAVVENIIDYAKMEQDEIELIPLPLNHTHGLRRCYSNLYNGSTISLMNGFSKPMDFIYALEKQKITSFSITALMFTIIMQIMGERLYDYRHQIRYVQFGASATPECDKIKARKLLPYSRLYNAYGTTEAGATCAYDFNQDDMKVSCIGQPTVNTRLFFADADKNEVEATKDNPGFISIESPVNMVGYWNEEKLTEEVLKDGKYYSKDLGYMDSEGNVYFSGRIDDIINIGGIKISPIEIEEVALRCTKVKECLCSSTEMESFGTVLKLGVVMNDGEKFDKRELENHMKKYLEASRLPKIIEQIEKVPRSYNDKIIRT